MSVNKVILVGRVGANPELKNLPKDRVWGDFLQRKSPGRIPGCRECDVTIPCTSGVQGTRESTGT